MATDPVPSDDPTRQPDHDGSHAEYGDGSPADAPPVVWDSADSGGADLPPVAPEPVAVEPSDAWDLPPAVEPADFAGAEDAGDGGAVDFDRPSSGDDGETIDFAARPSG